MPWPTTSGSRTLAGAEADLVRGAIGMMVDQLVAELRDETEQIPYGIEWFDQWDPAQRLWLLEQVTSALLSDHVIDSPAAIYDATADAIFYEIQTLIQIELENSPLPRSDSSWRQSVINARAEQTGRSVSVSEDNTEIESWIAIITRVADDILGVRVYQRAESFRDQEYERTIKFLNDRGLPDDYLSRIPELQTIDDAQRSIDRIQAFVFR